MTALRTGEPPTDAQLLAINRMCDERDIERPEAVWSKEHASEIITQIRTNQYRPADHRVTADDFDPDYNADAIPF